MMVLQVTFVGVFTGSSSIAISTVVTTDEITTESTSGSREFVSKLKSNVSSSSSLSNKK